MKQIRVLYALVVLLTFVVSHAVQASEASENDWHFQLATYGWLSGQSGSIASFSDMPPVDIDLDFWEDITGNINGAVNFVGEARKNAYGVVMDMVYSDIEFKDSTPGPYFSEVSSQTKTWIVSTAGLYRIIDNPANYVDLLAGVRYWSVESTLALQGGGLTSRKTSNREDWFDPFIGTKVLSAFGDPIFLSAVQF